MALLSKKEIEDYLKTDLFDIFHSYKPQEEESHYVITAVNPDGKKTEDGQGGGEGAESQVPNELPEAAQSGAEGNAANQPPQDQGSPAQQTESIQATQNAQDSQVDINRLAALESNDMQNSNQQVQESALQASKTQDTIQEQSATQSQTNSSENPSFDQNEVSVPSVSPDFLTPAGNQAGKASSGETRQSETSQQQAPVSPAPQAPNPALLANTNNASSATDHHPQNTLLSPHAPLNPTTNQSNAASTSQTNVPASNANNGNSYTVKIPSRPTKNGVAKIVANKQQESKGASITVPAPAQTQADQVKRPAPQPPKPQEPEKARQMPNTKNQPQKEQAERSQSSQDRTQKGSTAFNIDSIAQSAKISKAILAATKEAIILKAEFDKMTLKPLMLKHLKSGRTWNLNFKDDTVLGSIKTIVISSDGTISIGFNTGDGMSAYPQASRVPDATLIEQGFEWSYEPYSIEKMVKELSPFCADITKISAFGYDFAQLTLKRIILKSQD